MEKRFCIAGFFFLFFTKEHYSSFNLHLSIYIRVHGQITGKEMRILLSNFFFSKKLDLKSHLYISL